MPRLASGASPATTQLLPQQAVASELLVPNARVEKPVADVHQQVGQGVGAGHEHGQGYDHRIIPREKALHAQSADAGDAEDGLRDEGACHQAAHHQTQDGEDGDEGIAQDVAKDDQPLRQPLGPGGAHVVLPHHLQHAGPRLAGEDGDGAGGEHDGRHNNAPAEDALPASGGKEAEAKGQEPHQDGGDDEGGEGDARHHPGDGEVIQPRVPLQGGDHAQRDAHGHPQGQGYRVQLHRDPQPGTDEPAHRLAPIFEGLAKVAVQSLPDVIGVLDKEGPI